MIDYFRGMCRHMLILRWFSDLKKTRNTIWRNTVKISSCHLCSRPVSWGKGYSQEHSKYMVKGMSLVETICLSVALENLF